MNTMIYLEFESHNPTSSQQILNLLQSFNQFAPLPLLKEYDVCTRHHHETVYLSADLDEDITIIDFLMETFNRLSIALDLNYVAKDMTTGTIKLNGTQMLDDKVKKFKMSSQILATEIRKPLLEVPLFDMLPFGEKVEISRFLNTSLDLVSTQDLEEEMLDMYENMEELIESSSSHQLYELQRR